MPANVFKTVLLLLTLLATCTQCALNGKNISRYTPGSFVLRTTGSSASEILIFGWVLACIGSGVNRVTVDLVLISIASYLVGNRTSLSGGR